VVLTGAFGTTLNPESTSFVGILPQKFAGLTDKDFVTQAANAEMVEEFDRYLIL